MKTLSLLVLISFMAAACSGKDPFNRDSDPFRNYTGLDNSVPPHNERARTQYYVSDVFDIHFEEQQESRRILNFVEGQPMDHRVRARVFMEGVRFDLRAHNLPQGARFTKDSSEEGIWVLSWQPSLGFIPPSQRERQWDIQVELVPLTGDDSRAAANLPTQVERTVTFSLMVRHTEREPTIVAIRGLEGQISESSSINFTVEVADPAGHSNAAPQISWSYDPAQFSNETQLYSGQNGIDWNYENLNARQLSNGNWEFHLVYHAGVVAELHRERAHDGQIGVQFYLQAASTASQQLSPTYSHSLSIALSDSAAPGGEQ